MSSKRSLASRFVRLLVMGLLVSGLGAEVSETRPAVGYPEDWTHHHIKFTLPGLRQHPEILSREPRAMHQLYRQWRAYRTPSVGVAAGTAGTAASRSHSDWSVSLGNGTVAPDQYPAKWNSDPTAAPSCTADFVLFALNVAASGTQANLVGINNLYSGAGGMCSGAPNVLFAYNTNSKANGVNSTSPVLSLNGKKVAFVESSARIGRIGPPASSILHVLTLGTGGTIGAPITPASMVSVTFAASTDSYSSPWVDYGTDTLYVTADNGSLYKITGVFNGTPTLAGSPWPIVVAANVPMTGPVFDNTTGNIFMGGTSNGTLYVLNVNSPTTAPQTLAVGTTGDTNPGIWDAPVFDATLTNVLAISSNDGTSAVVVQATPIPTLTEEARVRIGEGSSAGTGVTLYDGDFDNAYITSPSTGHMLVCGTGAANTTPYRYRLPFNSGGIVQTDTSPVQITTNAGSRCGPVTDYYNPNIGGGTDFMMWGVTSNCGITGNPTSGCVFSLQDATTLKSAAEPGGTSGIIIDNDSTMGQASSFYFTTEEVGDYSAVKLTQLNVN